ncbi:hypothetical protein ACJX0J_026125, partial [Zea mays]
EKTQKISYIEINEIGKKTRIGESGALIKGISKSNAMSPCQLRRYRSKRGNEEQGYNITAGPVREILMLLDTENERASLAKKDMQIWVDWAIDRRAGGQKVQS